MINVTFIPKRHAPRSIKQITYHVDSESNETAEVIATAVFVVEHKKHYYDKIVFSKTRILK